MVSLRLVVALVGLALVPASRPYASPRHLEIAVSPAVVQGGGTVLLTCRVPPRPENRWLEMGILEYVSSLHQLDGDQARITWQQSYGHVPCEAGPAFCTVKTADGHLETSQTDILVSCPSVH